MSRNTYDKKLADVFRKSDTKPDKQFSFLPTVMNIIGNVSNKTILDLGCGDGFFSIALAQAGAKHVIGIDNAPEQIRLASEKAHPKNIIYQLGDIYKDKLPASDIILSPFVVNYAQSIQDLKFLFKNIYQSLNKNGKVVLVVDLPTGKDLKKFGSVKTLQGPAQDGAIIKIDLYNGEEFICTLYSHYYTKETLENTLKEVGFKNIRWHKPLVSKEGIGKFGEKFWKGFAENTELGYLSAEK
jgi:SAM-dependent methyltransferase